MTDHRCLAGRACRGAVRVDDPATGETTRQAATIAQEHGLCDQCRSAVEYTVNDLTETWLALHLALGDTTRKPGQRVNASRSAPINLNTDADALKVAIVEWVSAAAARVAEAMNISESPEPHNHSDTEHVRSLLASTRILGPNVDRLIDLEPDEITVWLTPSETSHAGESIPCALSSTGYRPNTRPQPMSGAELALKLIDLRRRARSFLMLTTPMDKLTLPCPRCNAYELTRKHERRRGKEIDQIDCGACSLNWPYEQYRNLTLIWVRDDEMEREKLQKQLDAEKERRERAEWLLARREWQISCGLDFPDVSASAFAATILSDPDLPSQEFMSDKDIANHIGVSDSTVRSWASKGAITRHTAADGSVVFLASEVWSYAKTNTTPRAGTVRRLNTARRINEPAGECG